MKKKILSLLLTAVLLSGVASFSGCTTAEDYDFTMWLPKLESNSLGYTNHAQLPVFKELEKRTGVKVKYIEGDYTDLTQLFSGQTYYDVMMLNDTVPNGGYPGGIDKGINEGVILDLTDTLPVAMPDYYAAAQMDAEAKTYMRTDAGKIGAVYSLMNRPQGPWMGYVMREDWLVKTGFKDAAGKAVAPETYDEWYTFLKKVKSQNLNGGKPPLFVYKYGVDPFNFLNAGYDIAALYYAKDDAVKLGLLEDGFGEYLQMMRKWYSEDLIDKSFTEKGEAEMAVNLDAIGSKGKPAQFAAFPVMYTTIEATYENVGRMSDADYSLIPVPHPRKNKGDKLHVYQKNPQGAYSIITRRCKDPEKVMKWLDYVYSYEGSLLMNFGIEGDTYNMVDGRPVFTDKILKNPQRLSFTSALKLLTSHSFMGMNVWDRELQGVSEKERNALEVVWQKDNDASYMLPPVSLTAAEGNEFAILNTRVQTYAYPYVAEYITGLTSKGFDAFVRELKTQIDIDRALTLQQNAYDRYKARGKA